MVTFLTTFALVMKQLFMCLESLTARIWETENPHITREIEHYSPKVKVWCRLLYNKVIGPFFFDKKTIAAGFYLDTQTEYVGLT